MSLLTLCSLWLWRRSNTCIHNKHGGFCFKTNVYYFFYTQGERDFFFLIRGLVSFSAK